MPFAASLVRGGGRSVEPLHLLLADFSDAGVEFGAAAAGVGAELIAVVFGERCGGGRGLCGGGGGSPIGLEGAVPGEFVCGAVRFVHFVFEAGDGWSPPGGGCLGEQSGRSWLRPSGQRVAAA